MSEADRAIEVHAIRTEVDALARLARVEDMTRGLAVIVVGIVGRLESIEERLTRLERGRAR